MRIRIRDISEVQVLAGAQAGATMLGKVLEHLPALPRVNGALFVDFEGIEVTTASFLREFVLPLKSIARSLRSTWYPVVANPSPAVLEELDVITTARSEPILTCKLDANEKVTDIKLAGRLDPKQLEAYEFVVRQGDVTAKQLMEATATSAEKGTSPTAWNNRLSVLVDKGLVAEASLGRQKVYVPILREN